MKGLIQIGKFQMEPDGLLLLSEADGLPFLVVRSEGITFDAGPFTGSFCDFKGVSKFTLQRETKAKNSVCSIQLIFAEGDRYPLGGFDYSASRYDDAQRWVKAANRRIILKKRDGTEDPVGQAQDAEFLAGVDA